MQATKVGWRLRGGYVYIMLRYLTLALLLASCATLGVEKPKKPFDPTAALADAVAACSLYMLTPEIPRDPALDETCEALLGNCAE